MKATFVMYLRTHGSAFSYIFPHPMFNFSDKRNSKDTTFQESPKVSLQKGINHVLKLSHGDQQLEL